MEGTVINNSNSDVIVVYMAHTDKTTNINPNLNSLRGDQIAMTGKDFPSDSYIVASGKNIYSGVWNEDTQSGGPDSWLIIDEKDGTVINSQFNNYSLSMSGDHENGWILTVISNTNTPTTSKTDTKTLTLMIAFGVLLLLVLIALAVGGYFIYRVARQ